MLPQHKHRRAQTAIAKVIKQAKIGNFEPQNCIKLPIFAVDFRPRAWHNRTEIEQIFYKGEHGEKTGTFAQSIASPSAQLGLDKEINDLRGLIEKLQGMARDGEDLDPQFVALADTLGRVYTQLATLIKAQAALRQDLDVAAAIHQAAEPIRLEKGLK